MEEPSHASTSGRAIAKELTMVITNLIGGLGNQMFQYAAGRALSLERGVPLRLDISGFANYELHHGFELQRLFNCPVDIAREADVREILGWQSSPVVRRVVSRLGLVALRRKAWLMEPHFHYWEGIKYAPSDCYLAGYWQSDEYFFKFATQIREDFSFRLALNHKNTELFKQIDRTNAVSLHVRRGDYVHNKKNAGVYEQCSLDYYNNAIKYIEARVDDPHFFIFSDDINWVKSHMEIGVQCHYVENNHGTESYNDMRLMSRCKNHIIANSSFSWWGAWLGENINKIVIAPNDWFSDQRITDDLLPRTWVRL